MAIGELQVDRDAASLSADDAMVRFAHELAAGEDDFRGQERRAEPRYRLCLRVLAIPVVEQQGQSAEPLVGLSRNISASGMAMLVPHEVEAKLLAVQLGDPRGDQVRMLMNVLRSRRLGGFHEIAGIFVAKL